MLQAPCLKTVAGKCCAAKGWVKAAQAGCPPGSGDVTCHMSNVNTASLPVRPGPSW